MNTVLESIEAGGLDPLLTVRELAVLLGVCEFTVRRKIWAGLIKSVRIGPRSVRVPRSEARRITAMGI